MNRSTAEAKALDEINRLCQIGLKKEHISAYELIELLSSVQEELESYKGQSLQPGTGGAETGEEIPDTTEVVDYVAYMNTDPKPDAKTYLIETFQDIMDATSRDNVEGFIQDLRVCLYSNFLIRTMSKTDKEFSEQVAIKFPHFKWTDDWKEQPATGPRTPAPASIGEEREQMYSEAQVREAIRLAMATFYQDGEPVSAFTPDEIIANFKKK